MPDYNLFLRFGTALAIGILIGLQREHASGDPEQEVFAGTRTFSLLALAGCTVGYLSLTLGAPGVLIGLGLPLGALVVLAYFIGAWKRQHYGMTSEVAALLTVLTGVLCGVDKLQLAGVLGVTIMVLLALKMTLHDFVRKVKVDDIYATLRFAVITVIILPLLPDQTFGPPPFDVLNPFKIWKMVVLISGISFLGYVLIKVVGPRQGIGLSGFLGGLVSSTAVTMSFTQRSTQEAALTKPFAFAILTAWTMMFARVLAVVGLLNPDLFRALLPPLAAAGLAGLVYSGYLFMSQRSEGGGEVPFANPFELGPAIKFGLLYALILLITRLALTLLGSLGVLISAALAGFTDVDAITLSMTQLSLPDGGLSVWTARLAVLLAVLSNTLVKGGVVAAGGSPGLRRALLPALVLILAAGLAAALIAPAL